MEKVQTNTALHYDTSISKASLCEIHLNCISTHTALDISIHKASADGQLLIQ